MPNFKSIAFKMAVLQGAAESAPHVCVIQKTLCGIRLNHSPWSNGINERHNAIIGNMAEKIHNETK